MFCDHCGKYNEEDHAFCYSCGSPLIPIQEKQQEQEAEITEIDQAAEPEREPVSSEALEKMEKELHQLNRSRSPAAALIAALLALAVILAVLLVQILKLYGAEQAAASFETAMLSGKWDTAYEYLYTEEVSSPFLSEEVFTDVHARLGASGYSSLTLEEVSSTGDRKVYSATYETAEGSRTDYISVRKTGNRKFLVLPEWKVDLSSVTASNVTIAIPSEAALLLGDLSPESEGVINEQEHSAVYTFDQLFTGIWTAELQAENRAAYAADIEVTEEAENGVISLTDAQLYPDQELMDAILVQFTEDYRAILEASVNREDFSAVQMYFAESAIAEGRAQNMYANACSQAYDPETGSGILSYELSDISAEFVSIIRSGYAVTGDLVMEIHSTMSYSYMDEGMEKSDTQSSVGLLCYHQENGEWKIQSFS